MSLGLDAGTRRFSWTVARASVCNIASAATAGIAGIVIARALGPSARGEYASIMAWFGVVLVVGQLGQTAATTFFVARDRDRASDYLATSRTLMVASGVVTLAVGMLVAPLLSSGSGAATAGYRLMFATCLASFIGASYVFSLQASHIPRWNLARLSQPVVYLACVTVLHLVGRLNLMTALAVLSATVVGQTALAHWLCGRERLTGGRTDRVLARSLTRYGLGQLASAVPRLVAGRMDMLVLSFAVPSAALGQYAVAASVTALALPVVSALGNVSFPRIAARTLSRPSVDRLQRLALLTSAIVGVSLMLPVAGSAAWLIPLVFGAGFRDAVPLVMLLAPGGVLLACGQVCADLLKGHGRPYAVAGAQTGAAVVTIVMLVVLVPWFGVVGAAITSSVSAGVALLFMLRALHRPSSLPAASADGGASGVEVGRHWVSRRNSGSVIVGDGDVETVSKQ